MEYLQYQSYDNDIVEEEVNVLNLVISGIPSILLFELKKESVYMRVLNLVISGIPSIRTS